MELPSGFLSTLSVGKQTQWDEFGFLKCSPYSSATPAKGMWFCLIRDHEWAHGKPPYFNYWSPWLPGLSVAGWGSMLQGPSHSAMLPEVTRASWFSDWVCVHECACQVQYSVYKILFSVDGMLQGLFKTYFQNICKPKLLQIFEQPDLKGWLANHSGSRKAGWVPARLVKWAIPHELPNIFICIFVNTVQLLYVYATAQVNSKNYLAMSQIRSHSADSNTNFDLIEEKGFGLVWSVIQELYVHEWLILQEQI